MSTLTPFESDLWAAVEHRYQNDAEFHARVQHAYELALRHAGPEGPPLFKSYFALAVHVATLPLQDDGSLIPLDPI